MTAYSRQGKVSMKHVDIELPQNLLDFIDYRAKQFNKRRDDVVAEAIMRLQSEWELEQGYLSDKDENTEFAEAPIALFKDIVDEDSKAR